ncbi:right-handed parallel beta-helix repeat-containing protein [Streptomyces sp. NPDC053253]|uniref:right-handed parallel beta-helix repeat-containing protein n=1 Tax=Streptomyces sp. NPDC053253 TaxID=3365699 RepID=UPI0037D49D15
MAARYLVSPRGGRRAYPDITSALRAAEARGRAALIEIAPGHYEEALTVRGEIRLAAAEGPGSVLVSRPRGAVLDAFGAVSVHGLTLAGRDAGVDIVGCHTGTLTLDRTEIRAHDGVAVHGRPHTSVTLRDSVVLYGRTVFTGSSGLIERCRFTDAANNAIAAIEGARVTVRGSRIEGSRIHGLRVCDAQAEIVGCEVTGTGQAAVVADTRGELAVTECAISATHAEGILFIEQSRGSVDRTTVTDALHGIVTKSGAGPVVRGSVFADCRDTGINVQDAGLGTFEHCRVTHARNVAVFSTKGGAPEVRDCLVSGGNVGIAVTEGGRGRFTRIGVEDLAGTALRVYDEASAAFEDVRVERCPAGLEARGNGGTTAEVTGAVFRDISLGAVAIDGQSRVTLRNVTAERGVMGFAVSGEAMLQVTDSDVTGVSGGGFAALGSGRLVARNITVTGSEGLGAFGTGSAYVDITDGTFTDCAVAASFDEKAAGRLVDCVVNGTGGVAVRHNGLVDLVSLRTSLPVVRHKEKPAAPPQIVQVLNNPVFNGPVFNGPVHDVQLAWNNGHVVQQQQTEGDGTHP